MRTKYFTSLKRIIITFNLSLICTIGFSQQKSIFDIARNGSLTELKKTVKNNPDVINSESKEGYTPLTLACYSGNNEVAKYLINNVKNINSKSSYGTSLMAAVVKNNKVLTKLLIQKKVDVNATDPNGTSALHYAVMFGLEDIIKILVDANADATIKDNRGNSAIDYAKIKGNKNIIKLLKTN